MAISVKFTLLLWLILRTFWTLIFLISLWCIFTLMCIDYFLSCFIRFLQLMDLCPSVVEISQLLIYLILLSPSGTPNRCILDHSQLTHLSSLFIFSLCLSVLHSSYFLQMYLPLHALFYWVCTAFYFKYWVLIFRVLFLF